jgi:hypothetical protein
LTVGGARVRGFDLTDEKRKNALKFFSFFVGDRAEKEVINGEICGIGRVGREKISFYLFCG